MHKSLNISTEIGFIQIINMSQQALQLAQRKQNGIAKYLYGPMAKCVTV